ncbi:phosphoglucan phosphatase LSF1, chloroplastic [Mangifera indica]|uniref:phosphoglucan phosphatase LSF1, chloroplastic n=1 Tax=Mangifera indica TaxID=29780 RepID=UPI001CFA3526|nr:phosphoglucan phosphatase LSF1, chloroplastic [Mangifera indica]XP_044466022.1 phosphoglucan phosphatase LSF1, chloroplastic [Mangifera indica]
MSNLQLSGCRMASFVSLFYERSLLLSINGIAGQLSLGRNCAKDFRYTKNKFVRVNAMSSNKNSSNYKMNLNEYMVTLEKPLGIRFAVSVDGKIIVHAIKKGSNAEKSRIIMVGDSLKKASDSSGARFIEINELSDTENLLTEKTGSFSLVLERPFSPFPIHQLHADFDILFNKGRMAVATWNKTILASNLRTTSEGSGNTGFVVFSSKFLTSKGWKLLDHQNGHVQSQRKFHSPLINQLVCIFSEEESGHGEWAHGSFPLEEYIKALDRSKSELYYNHSLGMHYSKITEQIYVGSCLQKEADVKTLSDAGITAVLNFQSGTEAENWGIDWKSLNDSCQKSGILMISYPIRDSDSFDTRKKLPLCVGLLLRLLKKNHHVFVTCTTGFDRSPACVIAYLHWITDTSLHAAYNFVTGLHECRPDRPAIAWATWDLIAMVESGAHHGPATHAVTFVWNGQEGDDVRLVGDFTGNWKEPIKAVHKGGSRFEAEVRLAQGKYYYKFIINGGWRHSTNSPVERDESGNVNNVITVGDIASVRPSMREQMKDANVIKVIERPLTESERFMLAKAARCIAFSVCPIRLCPK